MRYIFRDVMVQADYEDDHNYQSKQTIFLKLILN